jgi:hypothetical protein
MPGLREALRSLEYLPYKNVLRFFDLQGSMVAEMGGGIDMQYARSPLRVEEGGGKWL